MLTVIVEQLDMTRYQRSIAAESKKAGKTKKLEKDRYKNSCGLDKFRGSCDELSDG